MLLHDRVTIVTIEGGGVDPRGFPIPGVETEHILPAEVQPINTDNMAGATNYSTVTRFRVTIMPTDLDLNSQTEIWHDGNRLQIEGSPEPHMMRGRKHHLEMVCLHF